MTKPRRWGAGMLLERVALREPGNRAEGTAAADGVVDPLTMAGRVMGDYRRAETVRRWAEGHVATGIVTLMGTPVPARELRGRAALLDEVRRGNPQAARQLWETRRAWIITPASEGVGGREIPAQRAARVAAPPGPGPTRLRGD